MKRKIFWNMCRVALFAMVLATMLTTGLMCLELQHDMKQKVVTEVRYLSSAIEVSGEAFLEHLSSHGDGNLTNRITWIDEDGSVLYDSFADRESLENHKDRPEIQQVLKQGRGESTRYSNTLAEQTYYYASRLSDGTIIRVASTMKSGLAAMVGTIPVMLVMAMVIMGVTMLLAEIQTKKIVEPINRLNPDAPQEEKVYDELSPLVHRLEKQKETIARQIETLREKQEEFTAITENMKEGFLIVDSHADVISYNSSALRILGVDGVYERGSGMNVLNFNRSGNFRQVVDTVLKGERCEKTLDLNGRHYQIIANPVVEAQDKYGAVVVILDVTEQQNRESLRREFSANVSHELKTPLTSISGYAEIMKNGLVQTQDIPRFSEKIYMEAQRLIMLVGDIIRLSQLDEGNIEIEKQPVDLYSVMKHVAERLQPVAQKKDIHISCEGHSAKVPGVEQILNEMVFNLCDNAIKYNRQGGFVKMEVGVLKGKPYLSVMDNGIGIPKEEQERIFERFYRVDKSHSKSIGGTGLGLSIVKHGAIYHNASVKMESTPGKGTCVKIIF
ncbi:MAG: ATP-binding protein [Brotaphodocola sp.]